jgi:Immunoglobulin V-set domain
MNLHENGLALFRFSLCVLFVQSGWLVESAVTVGKEPVSMTVVEMETAQLPCPTAFNKSVWWNVRTILHGEGERRYVYRNKLLVDSYKNTGRYSVTYKEGLYTLTIINVTMTDAGEYQCIGNEGFGNVSSVLLKVKGMYSTLVLDYCSLYSPNSIRQNVAISQMFNEPGLMRSACCQIYAA